MTAITAWAQDVAVRAVKTFAQTFVGMLGAGALSVLHVAWQADLDVAAFAALVCVLHNVSSFPTPGPAIPVASTPAAQIQHGLDYIKSQYGTTPPIAPAPVVIGDVVPTVAGPPTVLSSNTTAPIPPVAG